jgi:hypothetical protein
MTKRKKLLIGGLGALTPLVLNLVVLDLEVLWPNATILKLLGYFIRVLALFYLGGLVAWLHGEEENPVKLFELGMTAPALITLLLNGSASKGPQRASLDDLLVRPVYAQSDNGDIREQYSLRAAPAAESGLNQFLSGLLGRPRAGAGALPSETTVFVAASHGQTAWYSPSLGFSVFTYALLNGLEGAADSNNDGRITLGELGVYLQHAVPQISKEIRASPQYPVVETNADVFQSWIFSPQNTAHRVRLLAIGVDSNMSHDFANLPSAKGASAFSELMRRRGADTTLLVGPAATRSTILRNIQRLAETSRSDDALVLYYGGPSYTSSRDGYASLVAFDSLISRPDTMIGLDEIKSALLLSRAAETVVFLDTCIPTGAER